MNWDQMNGYWKQSRAIIKRQWGKLTDDQLTVIAGDRDYLDGKFQAAYGVSRGGAQKRLAEWQEEHRKLDSPNSGSARENAIANASDYAVRTFTS